jgi:monoamine oxidase
MPAPTPAPPGSCASSPKARPRGGWGDLRQPIAKLRSWGELVDRFGDKAGSPAGYHEQEWTVERYSGGWMISHAPTGVLAEFGYTLRQPCGRIHWAGTESSAVMCG